jgi:hypothetical protein
MTRSNTLAVARVKRGARDRRNRAIAKRLVGGASTRAVGAEFGMTAKHIARIRMQLTGARLRPAYAPWPANRVARLRLLWRRGLSTAEIGWLLGVSKSAVVGKIDRLELPPPSAKLQARKRRHAGRPPFWVATRVAKLRKLWAPSPTRRSAASSAFPRLQSSARPADSDCCRDSALHPLLHDPHPHLRAPGMTRAQLFLIEPVVLILVRSRLRVRATPQARPGIAESAIHPTDRFRDHPR